MKKLLITGLLIVILSSCGSGGGGGQGTVEVSGQVTGPGGAISGAEIVTNSGLTTTTDSSGNYSINIPKGVPVVLKVKAVGYKGYLGGGVFTKDKTLDFTLTPTSNNEMPKVEGISN